MIGLSAPMQTENAENDLQEFDFIGTPGYNTTVKQ